MLRSFSLITSIYIFEPINNLMLKDDLSVGHGIVTAEEHLSSTLSYFFSFPSYQKEGLVITFV
jgi:hypothetical protein